MKTVNKIHEWMDKIIMGFCIVLFAFMVVIGTYQIVTRYFFNSPSTFSEELLTYTFTWMALLASAYVFGKRDHMRMAFIADKIKGKPKLILDIIIELLVLGFAALVMVWGGWQIMMLSMQQKTASLGVPMGYIYAILPFTGVAISIYAILNLYKLFHGQDNWMGDGAIEIEEKEGEIKGEMK